MCCLGWGGSPPTRIRPHRLLASRGPAPRPSSPLPRRALILGPDGVEQIFSVTRPLFRKLCANQSFSSYYSGKILLSQFVGLSTTNNLKILRSPEGIFSVCSYRGGSWKFLTDIPFASFLGFQGLVGCRHHISDLRWYWIPRRRNS